MTLFGRIFGAPRELAMDLAIATGIGAFLGVIGPFGSFNGGPLADRLFFWIGNLWIGLIFLSVGGRLTLALGRRIDLPDWFALPVGVALGSAPLTLVIALFNANLLLGGRRHIHPDLELYGQTLAIAIPCAFGYYVFARRGGMARARIDLASAPAPQPIAALGASDPAAQAAPSTPGRGFLDRLPPRLGRDLVCLQMEDHYVRVHTDRGSDLVLIPLKQALSELAEVEGLQVHRSWWVARRALAGAAQQGRNHVLRLTNGLEVPVARTAVAKARAEGWL